MTAMNLVVRSADEKYLQIEALPDGSTAIFDQRTNSVHSLDATAASIFRACSEATTASGVASRTGLDASLVLNGIAELHRAGLVSCSETTEGIASRRALLRVAGAAIPIVLSLTASEQKAYAQAAGSGTGPRVVSISPTFVAACGIPTQVVITGQNTNFTNASVITVAGVTEMTATNVVATSPTSLTATITIGNDQLGSRTVTVTTGGQVATGTNVLTLAACQ
jgi:hypothetical protein